MKIQTAGRYIFGTMLAATLLHGAVSAAAQERRIQGGYEVAQPVKGSCPSPLALTLNATAPNVFNADFTPGMLSAPRAFINDPKSDKSFLYTFQWRREQRCCEITSAVLTVKMRSNGPGASKTSPDAGNDGIAILVGGVAAQPFSGPVYSSWPFGVGQTATKTWTLTGTALNNLKANGTVSLYVQDDTTVESATLQIYGCCLSETRRESVGDALPLRRDN